MQAFRFGEAVLINRMTAMTHAGMGEDGKIVVLFGTSYAAVLLNICRVRALRAAVKEGTVKKVRRRQVDKDAVTLADSVHVLAVMLHSGQKQMRTVHDRQVEAHRLAHEGMSEWLKFPEGSSPEDNCDSTSQVHCAQAEPSHGGSGHPVHGGDSAGS